MMDKQKLQQHWFKHDINASNNSKLIKLQAKEGLEGCAVSMEVDGTTLHQRGRFELNFDELAFTLRINHLENANSLLESVIKNYGLFKYDDNIFYSDRVIEGLSDIYSKSSKTQLTPKRHYKKDKVVQENTDLPF